MGSVVEIAIRIGKFNVESGRNFAVLHGNQSSGDAGRATGALGMSNLRLQGRHRHLVGVLAEREFERTSLNAVIQLGGSAVQVDVVNVGGRDASFTHGKSDGARGLLTAF